MLLLLLLSHFSCVRLHVTPWTVAHQAPLSMGFSRQECWSGLSCPQPRDLPGPGIEPASLTSPVQASEFFTSLSLGMPQHNSPILGCPKNYPIFPYFTL